MDEKKMCKRCLLREAAGEVYKTVEMYLAAMDKSEKADEALTEQRLLECKQCDQLLSGMCRVCGCYVEIRAARKDGYCPDTSKRW